MGLFGASAGAAAALSLAAAHPRRIAALVSRGGRLNLARPEVIAQVRASSLLLVGALDTEVLALNRSAHGLLAGDKHLEVIPGASHLFEEPGRIELVATHAAAWFERYLGAPSAG